jgi:two-component system, LytTR family, response regulator
MGSHYRCLIVDDEMPAHLVIKSHISRCDDLVFSDSVFNGNDALKKLTENKYDIVFLDIEMPLVNGLEVMQGLSRRPATIVTTAYDKFAFDAYQHDAVDYLLKPVSFPRFLKSIEKARYFIQSMATINHAERTLSLRLEGHTKEVMASEIGHMQSIGNYVKIYFKVNKKQPLIVYDTLKNLLKRCSPDTFVQAHKSYLVNTDYIERIEKSSLILKDETEIPLGRKYELLVRRIKFN